MLHSNYTFIGAGTRAILRRALPGRGSWTVALLTTALAGCGGGGNGYCFGSCNQPPLTPTEVSLGLVVGDFAHNGLNSIVQTSQIQGGFGGKAYGQLKTYLATAAGTYATPVYTSDGTQPLYLVTADLNGDGFPDVVSVNYTDETLLVFNNNPQNPGTFDAPQGLLSPGTTNVAIADMNGDGLPDLVSADANLSLFLQNANGTFAKPVSLLANGADWIALGDLNGDGSPDVAATVGAALKVLFHTGAKSATTYATPVTVYTGTPIGTMGGVNRVVMADLNGDGANDLIVTDMGPAGGAAPSVVVLLQDVTHPGQFLPAVIYPTASGSQPQSVVVADVNGDGLPDIIVGGSSAVSVLLQSAATPGTFEAATNYPVTDANEVAVADINGDNLPDIVIATGATHPLVNSILVNKPGVLLQVQGSPGTFSALQDLP